MIHLSTFIVFCLLVCSTSCTRPLVVTHWDAKGIALINKSIASKKKGGYGYPKHNQLSRIVCFNKYCISKAESINYRKKYRFKRYKNNDPIHKQPARDVEKDQPVIAQHQKDKEETAALVLNKTQTFQHVYFETGKASLHKDAAEELDRLVKLLKENPALTITVSGHTDNIGEEKANLQLSQDRANAVINYFEAHGIDKKRLAAKGYGSSKPVATNSTEDGRNNNRRVEFMISDTKQ